MVMNPDGRALDNIRGDGSTKRGRKRRRIAQHVLDVAEEKAPTALRAALTTLETQATDGTTDKPKDSRGARQASIALTRFYERLATDEDEEGPRELHQHLHVHQAGDEDDPEYAPDAEWVGAAVVAAGELGAGQERPKDPDAGLEPDSGHNGQTADNSGHNGQNGSTNGSG